MNVAISDSENDKNRPRVSVVMPVHNSGRSNLESAIKSVLGQTLREVELVCVDDASTDCSLAVLREFEGQDRRVRIISFPVNRGTLDARAAAIEAAKGDYIVPLDPDDWLDDNACSLLCEAMDSNGWTMAQFGMRLFYMDNTVNAVKRKELEQLFSPMRKPEITCEAYAQEIFVHNSYIWTMIGKVYRRESLVPALMMVPHGYCINGEDGLALLTFLELTGGIVGFLEEKCYNYRWGQGVSTAKTMTSGRMNNIIRSAVFACQFLDTRSSQCAEAYARRIMKDRVSEIVYRINSASLRRRFTEDLADGVAEGRLIQAFSDLKISHAFFNRCGLVLRLMMASSPDRRRRLRRRLALARRIAGLERLMLRACKGRRKQKAGMK